MELFESVSFGVVLGLVAGLLLGVGVFVWIIYEGISQKRRRIKCRVMADEIISGQTEVSTKQVNKLIDELLHLNNLLIGESEEDRVRVEQLRKMRDERDKDGQEESK